MSNPTTRPHATASARSAMARLKREGRGDELRAQLARIYWVARSQGVRIQDRRCTAVTDKEAAHLLGTSVSTVNARRNELMGGSGAPAEYEHCPLVEEAGRRASQIDDRGTKVTTYRFKNDLFLAFSE